MSFSYSLTKQPHHIKLELATKLKVIRKSKKWTQAELAERAEVSLGSLKRFEQTGEISLTSLLKLAHVLGRLSEFETLFHYEQDEDVAKLFSV